MKFAHRIVRWFAVVSPPSWMVICALVFYGILEGLHQYVLSLNAEPEAKFFEFLNNLIVMLLVSFYSAYRGLMFHPAAHEDYLIWLGRTPWRDPTPLPLGPVHVVMQDLVFLGIFELMLTDAPLEFRLLIPALFLSQILFCWAFWMWTTGYRTACYELCYAFGALFWIASFSHFAALIGLIATYFLGLKRMRQTFADFPWGHRSARQLFREWGLRSSPKQGRPHESAQWGWAFDTLSPSTIEVLPMRDRLLLGGLVGWCISGILFYFDSRFTNFVMLMAVTLFCGMYCVIQVLRCVRGYSPPISLLGRVFTGRLVIPSYDSAYLPVFYYVGLLVVLVWLLKSDASDLFIYMLPLMVTLFFLLMNLACPEVNKWRLTSKARLTSWVHALSRLDFEQL